MERDPLCFYDCRTMESGLHFAKGSVFSFPTDIAKSTSLTGISGFNYHTLRDGQTLFILPRPAPAGRPVKSTSTTGFWPGFGTVIFATSALCTQPWRCRMYRERCCRNYSKPESPLCLCFLPVARWCSPGKKNTCLPSSTYGSEGSEKPLY